MLFFITVKCDSQEISLGKGNVIQGAVFTFLVEKDCILEFFSGILNIIHNVNFIPRYLQLIFHQLLPPPSFNSGNE